MKALVLLLVVACSLPSSPQPIAWNKEPCAHCHMLIGDPAYAAQIITDDGTVLSFDDPDCAHRYIVEHHPAIHRAWFHAGHGNEWIPLADVAFVRVTTSPMGSGLAAVHRGTPGAIAFGDLP